MLGKLLKYEFKYLINDFSRTYIIYAAIILILKVLMMSDSSSTGMLTLLSIFAVAAYVYTFLLAALTISHNVRRFKKNMFSHEGYLTNTLPVTPAEHITAKVIIGFVNYVISFFVIFIAAEILCTGTYLQHQLLIGIKNALMEIHREGMLIPIFLNLASGYLAFLLFCYLITSFSSMIGGSKGTAALMAIGIIILFIIGSVTFAEMVQDLEGKTILFIAALINLIIASGEFAVILNIIKNKLNLQ